MGGSLNIDFCTIKVCLQSMMVQSPPPEHPRSFAGHLNTADSLYGLKKSCFVVPRLKNNHPLEQMFAPIAFSEKDFPLNIE